jgi:hypothetical protein
MGTRIIEELLEMVISIRLVTELQRERREQERDSGREEAQCLGVYPGHPVPGGYKYADLALQVGGVSNLRQ